MPSKYWNHSNTKLSTWNERDRAHVLLETDAGETIIELWDEQVSEFIEDGFKKNGQHWHDALINYANEMDLVANNCLFTPSTRSFWPAEDGERNIFHLPNGEIVHN